MAADELTIDANIKTEVTELTKLRGQSPWANYTNRATASCRRN
jgi:hypothetical protein